MYIWIFTKTYIKVPLGTSIFENIPAAGALGRRGTNVALGTS